MASERIQRRIETLLDEADEAVAQSDGSMVLDRAQNVLRLDPYNVDALSYAAAAERDLGSVGSSVPSPNQESLEVSEDAPKNLRIAPVVANRGTDSDGP